MAKKALGAPDARAEWCKCCDELSRNGRARGKD